jgi:parvulin-like peptidyl-prolyl isomerase
LSRSRTVRGVLAVIASAALLAGCTSGPAGPLATVDGVEIPREVLEGWVRTAVEGNPSIDPVGLQADLLARTIQLRIFERILVERGLTVDPELVVRIRTDIETQLGGPTTLVATLADVGFPETFFAEVFLGVEAAVETLVLSLVEGQALETRTARHILVPSAEEAAEVFALLADGADFAELAIERSQDPGSGARGGSLGPQQRGAFVPPFDEAVWSARVGVVLEPVESQFGFHVIEVTSIDRIGAADLQPDQRRQLAASELDAIVSAAFLAADVTVDPTIGTWDPASGSVRPS